MKKTLLALVIASVIPAAAFADVTVYGKANVSVQNADEGDESQIEVVSNASRIGIKGAEEINSGLKAIYQFEYQTEMDDGAGAGGQTFGQRNIYVGLQGSGGTIIGGKFDTPTKVAQEKIDLFNDMEGDIAYVVVAETRANNIVQYTTPASWGAFAINVAAVAAEDSTADDGTALSLTYTTPALYLAVAGEQDVSFQGADIVRLVGRYTIGAFQLGALYEQASDDEADIDSFVVSAKLNISDKSALKAQFGDVGYDEDLGVMNYSEDGQQLSVGYDYMLSKNTTLFAYYTQETYEEESVEVMDDQWLGLGIDLKF